VTLLEVHLKSYTDIEEGVFRADIAVAGKLPYSTNDVSSVVLKVEN
jgi:hypothetical protein